MDVNVSNASNLTISGPMGLSGSDYFAILLRIIFSVIRTLGNSAVIAVCIKADSLRTLENSFHINLAVYDLLMCAACIPASLPDLWPVLRQHHLVVAGLNCLMKKFSMFVWAGNLVCLALIAVLRLYRLQNPAKVIKKKMFIVGIVGAWIISLLLFFVLLFAKELPRFLEIYCPRQINDKVFIPKQMVSITMLLILVLCALSIIRSYFALVLAIRARRRVLQPANFANLSKFRPRAATTQHDNVEIFAISQQAGVSTLDITFENITLETNPEEDNIGVNDDTNGDDQLKQIMSETRALYDKDKRMIISSSIVLSIFVLSYVPLIIGITANTKLNLTTAAFRHIFLFNLLNNVLNPFLYTCRNDAFRKEIARFFRKGRISPT